MLLTNLFDIIILLRLFNIVFNFLRGYCSIPMMHVPVTILSRFDAILEKRAVAQKQRADYKKWLRYFLDFCSKYPVPKTKPDQVRLLIDK